MRVLEDRQQWEKALLESIKLQLPDAKPTISWQPVHADLPMHSLVIYIPWMRASDGAVKISSLVISQIERDNIRLSAEDYCKLVAGSVARRVGIDWDRNKLKSDDITFISMDVARSVHGQTKK